MKGGTTRPGTGGDMRDFARCHGSGQGAEHGLPGMEEAAGPSASVRGPCQHQDLQGVLADPRGRPLRASCRIYA
eukprot:2084576-Pyramimonas_sp.AAC.1